MSSLSGALFDGYYISIGIIISPVEQNMEQKQINHEGNVCKLKIKDAATNNRFKQPGQLIGSAFFSDRDYKTDFIRKCLECRSTKLIKFLLE
jgi:pyruvate carboxylase